MDCLTALKLMKNNKLKELRKENKQSQKNVCEILKNSGLKIDRTTYSKYETGKRKIPCEVLIIIADFYDVSIDYLLGIGRKDGTALK